MGAVQLNQLRATAAACFEGSMVRFALLAGSTARAVREPGHPEPRDVDIAVYCNGEEYDLLDLLGRLTPLEQLTRQEIDLIVLDQAPLRVIARVLRDRIVLYSRDESIRVHFEDLYGRIALDHELVTAPVDQQLLAGRSRG